MKTNELHCCRGLLIAAIDMAALADDARDTRVEAVIQRVKTSLHHADLDWETGLRLHDLLDEGRLVECKRQLHLMLDLDTCETWPGPNVETIGAA